MKFGKSLHRLLEKVEDLFTPSRSRPDIDLVEELDKSWYAMVHRKPPSVSPVFFFECICYHFNVWLKFKKNLTPCMLAFFDPDAVLP